MKNKLIELNEKYIKQYSNNELALEKHLLIRKILQEKNCFLKMSIEQAYAILRDLNIPEKDIQNIYKELINKK